MKRLVLVTLLAAGCSDDGSARMATDLGTTGGSSTSGGGTEASSTTEDESTSSGSSGTTDASTVASTAPPLTTSDSGSSGGNVDVPDVIYVNFDGGDFTVGMDDASIDQSAVIIADLTVAAYPGNDRAAILSTIQTDFAPFDVTVTDQRPGSGAYAMVVITPTDVVGVPDVSGVGPLDCGDAVRDNVAFVITQDLTDSVVIGSIASGRLGTTFGIENATNTAGLSSGTTFAPGSDPSWLDTCIDLAFAAECSAEHAVHCPDGQQNAFAELSDLFGPA